MDIRKVKKLIELLEESGLSEIEITEGDDKVRISKQTTSKSNEAPMIGTYYQAAEPGAEAFVKVGDPVSQGDTLCIIEAMKMMNKIESDADGIIERVLVQNGDPVEFDEVLFLISQE